MLLVVIYGSAVRMEVKPVKLCISTYYESALERAITDEFIGSPYYEVTVEKSFAKAQELFDDNKVKALLYLPMIFQTECKKATVSLCYILMVWKLSSHPSLNFT